MNRTMNFIMLAIVALYQNIMIAEMPNQVAAFKQSLKNGVKIPNCANCDFRGTQDLAGVDAHGAHLPGVTFQPCIPSDQNQEVIMQCVSGQTANLVGINLSNANLFSSCFDYAAMDSADLTKADVSNSSFRYTSLKDAKLSGVVATNATFCNAIMPDGKTCTETWTGQGVTITCNCTDQDDASAKAASKASTSK